MLEWLRETLHRLTAPSGSTHASVTTDGGTGVESAGAPGTGGADLVDEDALDFDDEKLLDGIGLPVLMVDADGDLVAWNASMAALTGTGTAAAERATDLRSLVHPDDGYDRLLAEQVIEAPERAHREFDVERTDADRLVYEDHRTFVAGDRELCYEVSARPLYQGEQMTAVIQTVQDRTEETRRHEAVESLVEELIGTMDALGEGDLSARAAFEAEGVVDEELLAVVDQVNDMARRFESLAERVDRQAATLSELVKQSTDAARRIEARVDEQTELLDGVSHEMEQFSASMQEVASSADQIAGAADQARASANQGVAASERARDATERVVATSEDLVDTVQALESEIDEIEEILDIIGDVAEQTNLLAVNASIEAARADDGSGGFEVVADEVKSLADETRQHTDEIETHVETVQVTADDATAAVEESDDQIRNAGDEIEDALSSLEGIADAVDEVATGINEVAEANDDQATTVQEVMESVESARENAGAVEDATDEIAAVTDEQHDAIKELDQRVGDLATR
jgi:methyl-accepting chemotaxis protein